jgi:hypothetical protein
MCSNNLQLLSHYTTQKSYDFGSMITGNQASVTPTVCGTLFYATETSLFRRSLDGTEQTIFVGEEGFLAIAHDGVTLVFAKNLAGGGIEIYSMPVVTALSTTVPITGLTHIVKFTDGILEGISTNGRIWYFFGEYRLVISGSSTTSVIWSSTDLINFQPVISPEIGTGPSNSIKSMAYKYPVWVAVGTHNSTSRTPSSWTFNECSMKWARSATFPTNFFGNSIPLVNVDVVTVRATSFNGINFVAIACDYDNTRQVFEPLISRDGLLWSKASNPTLPATARFLGGDNFNVVLAAGANGNMVFVTSTDDSSPYYAFIFYTCDNGATWIKSQFPVDYDFTEITTSMAVEYLGGKTFIVVYAFDADRKFLISQDGGANWANAGVAQAGVPNYARCTASCVPIHRAYC